MKISKSLCFVAAGVILSSTSVSSSPLTTNLRGDRAEIIECFVAGTQILMADGSSENIEDIQPGDLVRSCNIVTRQFENRAVTTILLNYERRFK